MTKFKAKGKIKTLYRKINKHTHMHIFTLYMCKYMCGCVYIHANRVTGLKIKVGETFLQLCLYS